MGLWKVAKVLLKASLGPVGTIGEIVGAALSDDSADPMIPIPKDWQGPTDAVIRSSWERQHERVRNGHMWEVANDHDRVVLSSMVDEFFLSLEKNGAPSSLNARTACIENDAIRRALCTSALEGINETYETGTQNAFSPSTPCELDPALRKALLQDPKKALRDTIIRHLDR